MTPIEYVVRVVIDLLVSGHYRELENMSCGHRLTADHLRAAVVEYGRTLRRPDESWWSYVEVTPVIGHDPTAFYVITPFWTIEDGLCDLHIEMYLDELAPQLYKPDILNVYVP